MWFRISTKISLDYAVVSAAEGTEEEGAAAAAADPVDMLDRDKCIQLLAELRHAKWFQVS